MKPGRGKHKGNAFESARARDLSIWITSGSDAYQLISSKQSGGWCVEDWHQAGDIAPNGTDGQKFRNHVIVECKHTKEHVLWRLFGSTTDERNIQCWWEKLCKEADKYSLTPMIIFRQNNRPIMVVVTEVLAYALADWCYSVIVSRDFGIIPWGALMQWTPQEFYQMIGAEE